MVNATSTNTLGFIIWTASLTMVVWFASILLPNFLEERRKVRKGAFIRALQASLLNGLLTLAAVAGLTIVVWLGCIPALIYKDHQELMAQNRELRSRQINNPYEKSFIGSYAYTNTLGAFGYLVRDPRRQPNQRSECQIEITSAPDNKTLALSLRSIASAMGCYILPEPYDPDTDSESWNEMEHSLPNFAVIHAAKGNIRADGFLAGMSNTFHVQRSYDLPPDSPSNLVWLQIGKGSVWLRF